MSSQWVNTISNFLQPCFWYASAALPLFLYQRLYWRRRGLPTAPKVGYQQRRNILANATKVSGKFQLEGGPPNGTLYRANNQGQVTSYITYDAQGLAIKRVDVTGAAHNGVSTPHVVEYGRNVLPDGTTRVKGTGLGDPRPANADEIPR